MADEREPVEVTAAVGDEELVAGTLWVHDRQGQSATFRYDQTYLSHPLAYELDPTLPLGAGVIQTRPGKEMFNAFSDSAPDRWGQNLMRRQERNRAAAAGTRPRTLTGADFLLGAHDELRQGGIRFRRPDTTDYWSPAQHGVPRLVSLPRLLDASDRLSGDDVDTQAIRDLVNAGSSLGGARPKASVLTNRGELAIAKLPHSGGDQWDVPGWEKLEADLAFRTGINTASSELVQVRGGNVLISHRFDREGRHRVGFASALTMLEASDGDRRSYLEIAEVAEVHSPQAEADLAELYRRVVFSAMTANTDDHLRNHGFLRTNNGWRLAPAYDLNPNPDNPGQLTTAIDLDDATCNVDLVLSVAGYFRLSDDDAKQIVTEVETATRDWRSHAHALGLAGVEVARMEQAFDNRFRSEACRLGHTVIPKPSQPPPAGRTAGGEQPRLTDGRFTYKRSGEITGIELARPAPGLST
ncbi:MAG: type II toxin-antitoxin system HipA family toxin [Acidimicrobiales bacterium]